ncbi:MAG: NAD+ synthase, partial [Desulfatiglandales bacterium]
GLTIVLGSLHMDRGLYNAAIILHDGQLCGIYRKQRPSDLDSFGETGYFGEGEKRLLFSQAQVLFGVNIGEEILYPGGIPQAQALEGGAQLLINISAIPYYMGKRRALEPILSTRAMDYGVFLAHCNLVGAQDELVFDGHSLIFNPKGEMVARGKQFEEDLVVADLYISELQRRPPYDPLPIKFRPPYLGPFQRVELLKVEHIRKREKVEGRIGAPLGEIEEVYNGLVLGVRDYVQKNGFKEVVLGLSGGIDSSLSAAIAADALGPENVIGVTMPTRYTSSHSLEDAEKLAQNLRIRLIKIPIDRAFQMFLDILAPFFEGHPPDATEENLQPRIRAILLMALSNKFGWLVLSTGNKSEGAVGYSTLYGDTAGGFAPLKDVPKGLVYQLAHFKNRKEGWDLIPQRVLEKAPSAELRPNQVDSDSLPPYETLDPILSAHIEGGYSLGEILDLGFDEGTVRKVMAVVAGSEYKRRQSPPGVKITRRAFGRDWRLPITNRFRSP